MYIEINVKNDDHISLALRRVESFDDAVKEVIKLEKQYDALVEGTTDEDQVLQPK